MKNWKNLKNFQPGIHLFLHKNAEDWFVKTIEQLKSFLPGDFRDTDEEKLTSECEWKKVQNKTHCWLCEGKLYLVV